MFKKEERLGKPVGFSFETGYAHFFFGTRRLSRDEIALAFPDYKFSYMKQVHGKKLIDADPEISAEADAQFTSRRAVALISQTADCIPVLLANEHTACAIHSGWKGTALNITGAAKAAFPSSPPKIAAIGPHILKHSFEVGHDVAKQLLDGGVTPDGLLSKHADPLKTYFDLTEMVRRQLRQAFGAGIQIHECLEDTLTNPQFHSFRRDKQQAGRQYSFVVLKP